MSEQLNTEFSRYCRKFAEKLKIRSDMDATRGKRLFNIVFHNKTLLTAFCLLSLVIIAIIIGLPIPQHQPAIQGQLESTDYRVSTKMPSRVEKVCVHEGDYVEAGDTLVILSAPEVTAMERTAAAKHEATEATDALVKEGSRNEVIRTAYFHWQQAIAARDVSQSTYRRINNLASQGVVSVQKADEARAQRDAAAAAEQAAHEQYQQAVNGSRTEEKRAADARSAAAGASVDVVKRLLDETVLTAPKSGRVTEVFVEESEVVGTGAPIMNIETDDYWFTFYVTEDRLPGIDYGQLVQVYRPASDDTVTARVTRINNAGDFAAWKATRALNDLDLKVFDIRLRPIKPLKAPHEGESAVIINTEN